MGPVRRVSPLDLALAPCRARSCIARVSPGPSPGLGGQFWARGALGGSGPGHGKAGNFRRS
jgi:hypothetical protein